MSSGITITSASAHVGERDAEVRDEAEVDGTSMWEDIRLIPASYSGEDTSIFVERIEPAVELVTVLVAVSTILCATSANNS